jgi:RimJ/RimL family protein N-acetyltransferase
MPAGDASRALTISHAKKADLAAVFAFHLRRAQESEYLWPRDYSQFSDLVEGRQVFIVKDGAAVVGLAYLANEIDQEWEFGGVFVEDELRGLGVAAALGRVAISTLFLTDQPETLIAHVHEFNNAPRNLLEDQLGFNPTDEQLVAPPEAPENMKRNTDGDVVGDIFRFEPAHLADFADWFEGFEGTLSGRGGEALLTLNVDIWKNRGVLISALRDRAS